jgi:hypothetical protein
VRVERRKKAFAKVLEYRCITSALVYQKFERPETSHPLRDVLL